jgi:hypothetical protein
MLASSEERHFPILQRFKNFTRIEDVILWRKLTASCTLTYPPLPNFNPSELAPCLSNQLIFFETCTSLGWFAGLRPPLPRPPRAIALKASVMSCFAIFGGQIDLALEYAELT